MHVNKSFAQAFTAYVLWGAVPLYFHWVASVASMEVLMVGIVSSLAFLFILLGISRQLPQLKQLLADRKTCKTLALASIFLATNWMFFIYGVSTNRVLETSMGYYIGPIISVFLAVVFLGERLNRIQMLALFCVVAGIIAQLLMAGSLPWIALILAFSWGLYSLIKKQVQVPSLVALTVETLSLLPLSLLLFIYLQANQQITFLDDVEMSWILLLSGPVTVLPLLFFGAAVQKLSLIAISFMQYIAPTCTFMLAIFYFGETLDSGKIIMFIGIWSGVIIFSIDVLNKLRQSKKDTLKE